MLLQILPFGARAMESQQRQQANEDVLRNPKVLQALEGFLKVGFAPLDTPEKRMAVTKWAANPNAKIEDMPPGAMWVELPAGFITGIGDLQALRDVYRDWREGKVSGWTLVDAVSVIPGALGGAGFLVGMMRHGDEFAKLGKLWKDVEKLRAAGHSGEELLTRMQDLGHSVDDSRRVIGLGPADEVIGEAAQGERVIGGSERRAAPRGELDDLTIDRASRMLEDWDVPLERQGAEPAHWEQVRRAARGEGGDIDLDRMQKIQDDMTGRKQSYDDVALPGTRFGQVDANAFVNALERAEAGNPRVKDFHSPRSLEDWQALEEQGAKFFVNANGTAGGAVLPDGDMVNLFNNGAPKGVVGETLIPELIRAGGTKADWFDSKLTDIYAPYMDPVDRMGFDPQYLAEGAQPVPATEYARLTSKSPTNPEGEFADVIQGKVKPEVLQRLGAPEPPEGWQAAKAVHERAITDFRMKQALGFDPSEAIDFSGSISTDVMKMKSDELKVWLREQGAFEEGSTYSRLWNDYVSKLDPAEASRIEGKSIREQFANLVGYSRNLDDVSLAAITAMGHRGKGWYEAAAKSFATMFGADAPQVAALVAALSPNVDVPSNARMAMDLWSEWVAAGRPRDADKIKDLFDTVRYNKGENTFRPSLQALQDAGKKGAHGVVSNAINNTITVLSRENPVDYFSDPKLWELGGALSGEKVDPFFANLMGEFRRFTNDTHMNRLSAMKVNSLGSRAAQTAAYQGAANLLAETLGLQGEDVLKIANMQEMPWGVGRQMPLDAGYGNVEEYFFPGGGPMDLERYRAAQGGAAQAEDIAELLHEGETAQNLQRAGYDPQVAQARRTGVQNPEAFDEFAIQHQEGIRRAARRMDMANNKDYLLGIGGLLGLGIGGGALRAPRGLLDTQED